MTETQDEKLGWYGFKKLDDKWWSAPVEASEFHKKVSTGISLPLRGKLTKVEALTLLHYWIEGQPITTSGGWRQAAKDADIVAEPKLVRYDLQDAKRIAELEAQVVALEKTNEALFNKLVVYRDFLRTVEDAVEQAGFDLNS